MTQDEAREVRNILKTAHAEIMGVADRYREDHADDDWLGYTEQAAGCLRATFESPIPQLFAERPQK